MTSEIDSTRVPLHTPPEVAQYGPLAVTVNDWAVDQLEAISSGMSRRCHGPSPSNAKA